MKNILIIIGIVTLICVAARLYCGCCIRFMIQQEDRQMQERIKEERLLGIDDDPSRYRDTV